MRKQNAVEEVPSKPPNSPRSSIPTPDETQTSAEVGNTEQVVGVYDRPERSAAAKWLPIALAVIAAIVIVALIWWAVVALV